MILRKLKTFSLIMARCKNWPEIIALKLGLRNGGNTVVLRNGLILQVQDSLSANWGQVFEAAVADVYNIRHTTAEVFLDIGANIGAFSCSAALLHPDARVFSFEPSADEYRLLVENLRQNGLSNVTCFNKAVTCDGRDVEFSRGGSGGSSSIFLAHDENRIRLQSTDLSFLDLSKNNSVFIKLDCEGAEGEIIQWILANSLRLPARVKIVCEYHPWCPVSVDESVKRLVSAGFAAHTEMLFGELYLFASK